MKMNMDSYQSGTKLTSLNLINLIALMQANYKKREYDLKEKGLVLFNNLFDSLTEQDDNLDNLKKERLVKNTNNPYATFICNYYFKIIKNPLDLLEENFIFAFIAAIELVILLNDIDIQDDNDPLLEQKIQDLFNKIKNKLKDEMIRSGLDENKEYDYNLIVFNQLLIVKQLERMIAFYQSLSTQEQSKTPLINMIKLSMLQDC